MSDIAPNPVDMVILPPVRELGDGFTVRRALPSAKRRMVGPFIFFDEMGPVELKGGEGLDVRPHPHIGLSTVTYLFEGEILHRDSLGVVQPIRPGAVNWMTAGRGIVHSERSDAPVRAFGGPLHGIQTWVALPTAHEADEPSFSHHAADTLPEEEGDGVRLRLIAGSLGRHRAPVPALWPMVYADIALTDGARLSITREHEERALYIVSGGIGVAGQDGGFGAGQLIVLKPGAEVVVTAHGATRLMLAGGAPLPERRHIYWNFVSSSPERIEQAKADWRAGRFARVPGETEFIPLPDDPRPVRYP